MKEHSHAQEQAVARSVESAAKAIGVGRTTLYELIASGAIRTFKVGARTLIPESELHRFVAERMAATA